MRACEFRALSEEAGESYAREQQAGSDGKAALAPAGAMR
jgi:hypothetical protein